MTAESDSALMGAQTHSWLAQPGRVLPFCTGNTAEDFLFHKNWKPCRSTCTAGASIKTHSAGLAIPGGGVSTNLQLPLPCISLSKDPSGVTSTSATAAADISLHSILAGHKRKNRQSCLKPWLHTALVSVHLWPHKHMPAMCLAVCRAMESCTFVLCWPGSSVPVNKLTKW